ncbi:MAG: nucleotidyltransferase domain-containing protein [Oscillospiraceae bacterium]|jgi:predicted nucleotidyltransferase|nr:nucleotidyltransferase domain-containing protein [Oscillospiraceae bacterium]
MKPYETPEIREKLDIIKAGVLQVVPDTEAIYLFGSYAYGVPHKDSDLDICVIVPDTVEAHPLDVAVDMRVSFRNKLFFPLDLVVQKSSVFVKKITGPTLERVISNKGVQLYG